MNSELRIAIADDEPAARQRLERLIGMIANCRVVGNFGHGEALLEGLRDHPADLVLLDISMPGPTGLELLPAIRRTGCLVSFVTASETFAVEAFEGEALDYLLKPVTGARLAKTLSRARCRLQTIRSARSPADPVKLQSRGRTYYLEAGTITSVEAMAGYVEISTGQRKLQLRSSLADILASLDPGEFIRVHRSWVISRSSITQVTSLPGGRREYLLKDGRRIPGGRRFKGCA